MTGVPNSATTPAMLATLLDVATTTAADIPQLSAHTPMTLEEAYAVQLAGIAVRGSRDDLPTGLKLGFTSKEKAEQMGVSDVILGVVTASMAVEDGGVLDLSALIHPRIEPEIAFLLAPSAAEVDLADPSVDLLDHVTHVAPALEIIDSRYSDFSFSLEDVVADNTSASRYVVGAWQPYSPGSPDLTARDVTLSIDAAVAASGSTGAILGDPANAPGAVQRLAARFGHPVPATGGIVLAGAATAAVPLPAAVEVTASIAGLGSVRVSTR